MFSNSAAAYPLGVPSRCISAIAADTEEHRFLVGTCGLRQANELHQLTFHEQTNELLCDQVYHHSDELWVISPSLVDSSLVMTCANSSSGGDDPYHVTLSRLPRYGSSPIHGGRANDDDDHYGEGHGEEMIPVEKVVEVCRSDCQASAVIWDPHTKNETKPAVVVCCKDRMTRYTIAEGRVAEECSFEVSNAQDFEVNSTTTTPGAYYSGGIGKPACKAAALDPHRANAMTTVVGCGISCWDTKSGKRTHYIKQAHRYGCLDVDYNPNRPFNIVTAGEDRLIRFWDIRKDDKAVKSVLAHNHWACTVKYNPFHDQLLVSGGSDNVVHMWRMSSISSAPLLEPEGPIEIDNNSSTGDYESDGGYGGGSGGGGSGGLGGDDDGEKRFEAADIKVRSFDDHEDSVYAVAWSACDAWIFGSVSYDGNVVVNHVPSTEKYKILL